ncbi:hypothetical protein [Sinosporangium siamense]|uniref:Uncharacterized protein n=1 Tax=Sinosporangium siamense TaxID=1367973 RepID=A0A919RKJ2_9ACTN|nr:hypothetical protein [Sinosporangium siamense]GII93594.1 hypothetical protein Ssi02_38250 [Sinosporangium siamense]
MNTKDKSRLGLPFLWIVGLALLAVPRAILHDLHLIEGETFVNFLLVVVPLAVWIAVAVRARVPSPFLTLLVVGALYGVLLAGVHQVLWETGMDGASPSLGGNLAGRLSPASEGLLLRSFAVVSSLFTGVLAGAITGLIAWGGQRALGMRAR